MRRVKTFDIIRGWCMFMMVWGHMLSWWMISQDSWLTSSLHSIFGDIVGIGFLFISGLSAVIFFRSRLLKAEASIGYSEDQVRHEYLFRALLILAIALMYNSIISLGTLDLLNIWKWYIPLTIAFSLLISFPLLTTLKSHRLIVATGFWLSHYFILSLLVPYQGKPNTFGILYHFLYNSIGLHPILLYFSFFLIGTVIGDIIFEIYLKTDQEERRMALKNEFLLPSFIIGPILIIIGILSLFPRFLTHATFSSTVYSLGVILISTSILLIIEEFELINAKRSYRFFFYFSYYSFSIYFAHNMLYFILFKRANALTFWIFMPLTFLVIILLLRVIYTTFKDKASIKAQIGKLSVRLAFKVKKRSERIEIEKGVLR
ncbi:MAG: hypothetical protein ACFFFT_08670 [Candidatus Thorarchaeota archaeon]